MREGLEALVGILPPETIAELSARSMDSRSLIRAAYKWSGCVDCGRAPWKTGEDYVSLGELDCDHIDSSTKTHCHGAGIAAIGSLTNGQRQPGRGQDMWSYFIEMIKTEVRCKPCHDKLRGKQRNGQRNGHVETYEINTLFDDDPTFARGPYKYN